ncbi:Protein embryonic flower 1 [Vitis vinifera]|uniref:Protein embryonic flower 1 n=1 Tax=Vitis vinifera TaxID=29760 RepID=A0A438C245_VITVI|nr:Protein embryonic flower 1 [Vitis vinifera]
MLLPPFFVIEANPELVVKDFSGKCNTEKAIEFQELSEANRKHSDHRVDEVFEQGTSDDIPMEIVELMARNQYERCLSETRNDYHLSETTNDTRNAGMLDFTKVYANEAFRLLHEENSHRQKPQSSYGRNSLFTTAENVGSSREKSGSYFSHFSNRNHFNMAQPEGTHGYTGVIAFPVCQEKPSSGVQFSCPGPSRHNGASNCKWGRDMVGQRSSHTSLHAFEAYNACYNAPQQREEAAHGWFTMTPNHMAFGFSIPQECATHPNNMNMISHSAHVEYPFACNDNGIKLHPKLMGSLDLYSKENKPAMHLLSLMDSGTKSSNPFSMEEDSKFLKKSAFPRDYDSREFSGLEIDLPSSKMNLVDLTANESRIRSTLLEDELKVTTSESRLRCILRRKTLCVFSCCCVRWCLFASSSQKDGNFKPAGLIDQVLPRSRRKRNQKVFLHPYRIEAAHQENPHPQVVEVFLAGSCRKRKPCMLSGGYQIANACQIMHGMNYERLVRCEVKACFIKAPILPFGFLGPHMVLQFSWVLVLCSVPDQEMGMETENRTYVKSLEDDIIESLSKNIPYFDVYAMTVMLQKPES